MQEQAESRVGAGRLAALYAREPGLSEHERTPVGEQLEACRALASQLGYATSDEATLADTGPGTTMSRPGLTALLGLITQHRVAAVVVYTLDRLARHEGVLLDALLKELRRREVPLYVARTPKGYRYDPATGELAYDTEAVAAANQEDWRPPEYIIIPREYNLER